MTHHKEEHLASASQKRIEKIEYLCTAENISPNLAVHEIRKHFKRIRALLKLYSTAPDNLYADFKKQLVLH